MNQRHIQEEDYSFKDSLFKNLKNNNKDSGTKKKYYFSNHDCSHSSHSSSNSQNNNNNNVNDNDYDDTIRFVNNIDSEHNDLV